MTSRYVASAASADSSVHMGRYAFSGRADDDAPAAVEPVRSGFRVKGERDKIHFLLHASEILSSSLDYETTLTSVANLIVPTLAEWCTVHIKDPDGSIHRVALTHKNPERVRFATEFADRYPTDYDAPRGIGQVLRSGEPEFIREITDDMLVAGARDAEHLAVARSLQLSSYMAVPLIARGNVIGALSLFAVDGRHYVDEDVRYAETLASRAAMAVDNARLYQEAQRMTAQVQELNQGLERKVEERTKELRLSQETDRSNLHRLKAMLSSLPMAALMTNERDQLLELNEEYCRTFSIGLTAEEAMAIPPESLNQRFQRVLLEPVAHMERVAAMLKERRPLLAQDILLQDGRIVQRDYLPIYDEGKFLGQLFLYRDVTRERRLDAVKSEFMSLASHQLRTPLTSIRWALSILHKRLSENLDPFLARMLQEGRDGAQRMSDTIDTMLQISKIESGEVETARTLIDVREFVEDIMQVQKQDFSHKEQRITVEVEPGLVLCSDPHILQEVLTNLVNNAFKYTPEKGAIRLAVRKEEGIVRFHVQDSGYGIPAHQQASLFRKFFRGDNVVDKVTTGTGLGLYLVSLLTNLLGGTIAFTSTEGKGTTFSLCIPNHECER